MAMGEYFKRISKDFQTPCYVYDIGLLKETLTTAKQEAEKYNIKIHYAIKANNNPHLLKVISETIKGADCVSAGEIQDALEGGFSPDQIVLAGVGKKDSEIREALRRGILALNVESLEELFVIADIAQEMGYQAPIALRINPNIEAHTHEKITTGKEENKFGLPPLLLPLALETLSKRGNQLKFMGLHLHVGSQILDLNVFREECRIALSLIRECKELGWEVPLLNLGGGLGVVYTEPMSFPVPPFGEYFKIIAQELQGALEEGIKVHVELGRSLVAQCGLLLSQVLYVKQGIGRQFAILDAGMTDLMRPALYGALHHIEREGTEASSPREIYDVVGPICESSDTFAKALPIAKLKRGDRVLIFSAGAYGEVMSSRYNSRELPSIYFI